MKRFWDKVKKTATCWLWTAAKDSKGYGQFGIGSRLIPGSRKHPQAHRIAWELINGPIPVGLHVLHRCDVPECVNPDHLFLGTHQENMQDAVKKGRAKHPELHGSSHGMAKLTEEDVREIRRRTDMPNIALAKAFMVCKKHIYHIRKGLFWKHI